MNLQAQIGGALALTMANVEGGERVRESWRDRSRYTGVQYMSAFVDVGMEGGCVT